tara:strand:- start:33 stop:605 length:573 start_codon:yes stop_codon:yes gene_type:complete
MKNLKQIFDNYKKKTKKSITQTSLDMGWSQSALGLYLTGARPIPRKDVVTAANFFGVDPRDIDSNFIFVDQIELPVIGTLSGDEPRNENIKFSTGYNELEVLHVDCKINIEAGPDCDMSEFLDGGFLPVGSFVSVRPVDSFWLKDQTWPMTRNRTWLLKDGEKCRVIKNKSKPYLKNCELIGYVISIFYG